LATAEEQVEEEKGRKILFLTVAGGGGQRASYPTTLYLGEFLTVREERGIFLSRTGKRRLPSEPAGQ